MKIELLMFSVAPSFEDGFVLTFIENKDRDKTSYLLNCREVKIPSRETIGQEFSLAENLRVPTEDAEEILQILTEASISAAPSYALGLDGIGYELRVMRGMNTSVYKWWQSIPRGWESLAKVSNALLKLAGKPELSS